MTEKTQQPTGAEIDSLGHRMCWRYKHDTGVNHISTFTFNAQTLHNFARAVLDKWGQPAHSGEPVAWLHDCAALLTNDVELWIDACPHCGRPRNAPQPVEREPLTPREIELIDGMIAVQLDHAMRCDAIANRAISQTAVSNIKTGRRWAKTNAGESHDET